MADADLAIGRATPEDFPRLKSLLKSRGMDVRGLEQVPWVLKATIGGEIVGMAGIETIGPYGFLRSFAVDKRYAGRKIGSALWRRRLELIREDKLSAIYGVTAFYNIPMFIHLGLQVIPRSEVPPEVRTHWQFTGLKYRLLAPFYRALYLKV